VRRVAVAVLVAAVASLLGLVWLWRRALPTTAGEVAAAGVARPVEVLRDRWGIPHIFAQSDEDAAFALGYCHAQDRLFQMELSRRASQGRLAELLGPSFLDTDKLFRTVDLFGPAARQLARARPEARAVFAAYANGINAAVADLGGRLPPEFTALGTGFPRVKDDDFVGILGFMAWGLNQAWTFDPLFEKLVAKVGPDRVAELFPYNRGGRPAVHPEATGLKLSLLRLSPPEEEVLGFLPSLAASNNWVVGPKKSATGHPILANDPHLGHGLPGIWYEAHLVTPTLDVIGVGIPGLPFLAIGHNRDIAWGFTNVMLDGSDFFVETLRPETGEVLSRGAWVKLETREEVIEVKGEAAVTLQVERTPHGPLVSDLLPGEKQALSFQWNYYDEGPNEVDGFYDLMRARSWDHFRAAVSRFGAVSQNIAYADRVGHIGLQTTGAVPRLKGAWDGSGYREGASGEHDWDGFVPFAALPSSFDPPQGFLASANNPTLPSLPYYVSSQWEPVDRYTRIAELLQAKEKLSVDDMKAIQGDGLLVSARAMTPALLAAFAERPPSTSAPAAALKALRGWDFQMRSDGIAPSVFAAFYRRLFHEVFEDEMGAELVKGYRSRGNLSAIMLTAAMADGGERWFDRADTPHRETKAEILRVAFENGLRALEDGLGPDPASWSWDRLHTIELQHPLGRASAALRPLFNRGPFPLSGHTNTVNKGEFAEADFRVKHGPSMRQITDLGDLAHGLGVIPAGQSGLPASVHYDDLFPLWRSGAYHPLLMDKADIEKATEGRLILRPATPSQAGGAARSPKS
jgi:penicillin amidase